MPEKKSDEKQKNFLRKKVEAIEVDGKSISQLLNAMANTGFQGKKLAEIVDVYEKMANDRDVTILFGYAGSLSTTGQWKIINWLIENRFIDVLVGTGANLSEDIVEAMGFQYWQGHHNVNDEELLDANINRYYDVYGTEADYMKMTELLADFYVNNLKPDHPYSSREIFYLLGKWLEKRRINSIVATAAKHKVPVFCPAIVDSPYGDAGLIAKSKGFNLVIDNMKDYVEFMKLSEKTKETGVIYIGGGVPKDFIQLFAVTANLMYPDREVPGRKTAIHRTTEITGQIRETYYPHKYALQITTDSPQWGGLSGCTFEEATSWGKELPNTLKVQCYCDATIALPIVTHALNERIKERPVAPDFSWFFKELDKV